MKIKCTNINWETDGEDVSLPQEVNLNIRKDEEQFLADKLSDRFGWLVNSFEYELV